MVPLTSKQFEMFNIGEEEKPWPEETARDSVELESTDSPPIAKSDEE